jgi:cobalt-zinc-cadmium efflux system protein
VSNGHDHTLRAGARHRGRLLFVLGLVVVFMIVQVVVGILADSLAVLSDAGHMATDALGLGMAIAAIVAADGLESKPHRTFGVYRLEILAALANAVLLFAVAGYVLWEAFRRIDQPAEPLAVPMIVIAGVGLAVNLVSWWVLRKGAEESLNVEGAFLEVIADLLGSIGVLVAALVIAFTGWSWVDPVMGAAIGLFILPRAWHLGRRAVRILIEAAPPGLDLGHLAARLASIDGVVDVHDLHVWTLTSDMEVASAHLMTTVGADSHAVLDEARSLLTDDFHIEHATLQVEPDTHEGCTELQW